MDYSDINTRLENARKQLEEISKARQQTAEYMRQLELAEASWKGFVEALSPYVKTEVKE